MRKAGMERYTPDEQNILKSLGSKYVGERLAVEQRLRDMGPKGAELLLEFLKDETRGRQSRRRVLWGVLGGGISLAFVIGAALVLTHHPEALAGLAGFSGLAGLAGLVAPSQKYHQIINALSQLDDVRAVGPLAEALSLQDLNSRVAAARALAKLLPRLQREDGALLDAPQKLALQKLLNTGAPEKESGLMFVVIAALTTIQDVSAIPTMERLARRTPQTVNERAVVEAAARSEEILREAKLQMETPQTLLRASEESTAPEQLLRAANASSDTPVEQLLRAGN